MTKRRTLIIDMDYNGIIQLISDPEDSTTIEMISIGYIHTGRASAVIHKLDAAKGQQLMQFMAEQFEAMAFSEARKKEAREKA